MMRQYLGTVVRYSRDEATVYVADNASTDESLQLLGDRQLLPLPRFLLRDHERPASQIADAQPDEIGHPQAGEDAGGK